MKWGIAQPRCKFEYKFGKFTEASWPMHKRVSIASIWTSIPKIVRRVTPIENRNWRLAEYWEENEDMWPVLPYHSKKQKNNYLDSQEFLRSCTTFKEILMRTKWSLRSLGVRFDCLLDHMTKLVKDQNSKTPTATLAFHFSFHIFIFVLLL